MSGHDQDLRHWGQLAARYRAAVDGLRPEAWRVPLDRADHAGAVERAYQSGSGYDPQFQYREVPDGAEGGVRELAAGCGDDPWSAQVAATCQYLSSTVEALRRRDAADLTEVASQWFGPVDPEALEVAKAELLGGTPDGLAAGDDVGAYRMAALLGRVLDRCGLGHWELMVDEDMVAKVAVAPGAQRVRVRHDARFTAGDVRRLVVHEIGCHAFRYENGAAQAHPLLCLGVGPYLHAEEGLAVWLEGHHRVAGRAERRKYALRLVAVDAAVRGSFSDTYAEVRRWADPDEAYEVVVRVKRGLSDTSRPGAYTKDKVYLEGSLAVQRAVDASPGALDALMVGKVPLQLLGETEALLSQGLLAPAERVPGDALRALDDTTST